MAMVASASVRRTRRGRRGRKEEKEGGGGRRRGLKIAGGGLVPGRRDACEGKKGGLRASAPHESGGISGRTGEKHPLWMLEMGLEMERKGRSGKNGLREGKGRGVATRRGCKCPRDVSDRCGSTPSLPQTPSPPPCPLTTRPKNVLRMESGWITTVLFLSS